MQLTTQLEFVDTICLIMHFSFPSPLPLFQYSDCALVLQFHTHTRNHTSPRPVRRICMEYIYLKK
jgi:hypothetical protein